MDVSVIGCGYVGLTTGLALAELDNNVVLVDVIPDKLETVRSGKAPFYEPEVNDALKRNMERGAVSTTMDTAEAVRSTDITFIAVGTPPRDDGSMDDIYILSASKDIGKAIRDKDAFHTVVMKSTVVPGTTTGPVRDQLEEASGKKSGLNFGLAMCPEFLREGSAMYDSLNPDRVVIGTEEDRTFDILKGLFEPLKTTILRTTPTTAEMIKYASNSLLATKISFANEISRICEEAGIDVYEVMKGVGMDFRISPKFLRAGVGFGGSCFPKDVSALRNIARSKGIETPLLDGVMGNNDIQPRHLVDVTERLAGPLEGKRVAVLGLAFKPDTDDIRETRSLPVVKELLRRGAEVGVHDPKAAENFKEVVRGPDYFGSGEEALRWAEIAVLMTEWPEYRSLDWDSMDHLELVVDGRRSIDPSLLNGIRYWAMGSRPPVEEG